MDLLLDQDISVRMQNTEFMILYNYPKNKFSNLSTMNNLLLNISEHFLTFIFFVFSRHRISLVDVLLDQDISGPRTAD